MALRAVLREAVAQGGPGKPYLEDLLRQKPYQLQPETERVLSALRPAPGAPHPILHAGLVGGGGDVLVLTELGGECVEGGAPAPTEATPSSA